MIENTRRGMDGWAWGRRQRREGRKEARGRREGRYERGKGRREGGKKRGGRDGEDQKQSLAAYYSFPIQQNSPILEAAQKDSLHGFLNRLERERVEDRYWMDGRRG